jgi:hypothetical protein
MTVEMGLVPFQMNQLLEQNAAAQSGKSAG